MSPLDLVFELTDPQLSATRWAGDAGDQPQHRRLFRGPPSSLGVWNGHPAVPARALLDRDDDPRAEALATYVERLQTAGLLRPASQPASLNATV